MANITGKKTIFFVTSPRSPHKLVDEVRFLTENFSGKVWNTKTQQEFYTELSKQPFFEGSITGDIAFKARDRINRAPKSLGLVDLKPTIQITEAGKRFIYGKRPEEAFLRQLLKFQLASPYHVDKEELFNVRPYLELMRLIEHFDGLSKNEIALFAVQITDFSKYDLIKEKINKFREQAKKIREQKINYKVFVMSVFISELKNLFNEEISGGGISLRESKNITIDEFIDTKRANQIDYADAAIRYLRASGLFTINPRTFKIYVIPEKKNDLDYILKNTPKKIFDTNESAYKKYLFDPNVPRLLTDNMESLVEKILNIDPLNSKQKLEVLSIDNLKDIYDSLLIKKINNMVECEKSNLKTYSEYEEIIKTFYEIEKKEIVDPSLFFEWNVWRSFAMLNDGNINGNFRVDDDGVPLYTAGGNLADIVCVYDEFEAIVEVTLSSGHKQYEMEGEPVARHYGDHKKKTSKDVYCIFIAPKLSEATIAHYYTLHRVNVEKYGGKAKIIPIDLVDLRNLLNNAYYANKKPKSTDFKKLWSDLSELATIVNSETEWRTGISKKIKDFLR